MQEVPLTSVKLSPADIKAELERRRYNFKDTIFPDTGPLRRELYPRHMDFLRATKDHREVAMIAANRVGKSIAMIYAIDCFLRGEYPHWWEGRVFKKNVNCLVAGETGKLVRDSIQMKLMGPPGDLGSGMIPKSAIIDVRPKAGIPDAIDTARIRHVSGRDSILQFGSFDQGREAFQATERDVVALDEEPPMDVYSEALIRLMTTQGLLLAAFTPLKGISEVVLSFMDSGVKG